MWQRFTENARKVIFYSQEEAQRFGEGYVSTEHILLGLTHESGHKAAEVLNRLGLSMNRLRAEVEKQLPRGDTRPSQDMTLTPRAKRVIDLAYDEARNLSNDYIGTEHLLLGLIREGDGIAGRVFANLDVDLEPARRMVADVQKERGVSSSPPPAVRYTTRPPAATSPATLHLPVKFDFSLLHPVDQILVGILCDTESDFGKRLREEAPSLEWVLPAIVAMMRSEKSKSRESLATALSTISADNMTPEILYQACVRSTTPEIRKALDGLGLTGKDK